MITYDTREWFSVFSLHKADTFRRLWPLITFLGIFTAIVAYLELQYFQISERSYMRNIPLMHSLLGFAISMLLVFRTNTAYDRWWEGRKMWGGLVNTSRNMALKFDVILPEGDRMGREFFAMMIPRFAYEMMSHLRSQNVKLELDEKPHPEIPDFDTSKHMPAQVAQLIYAKATQIYKAGHISGEQLLTVNNDITELMNICGSCERIRNTPIPYSYTVFIKKFIFIYMITLPLGYVFSLSYLAVPVVCFIFYVLASLEVIAEDIEEPFGTGNNDLPMERLCVTINKSVKGILGEPA